MFPFLDPHRSGDGLRACLLLAFCAAVACAQQEPAVELEVEEFREDRQTGDVNAVVDARLLEEFAWKKGDYRIVPYGIGWLNMSYDTSRMDSGPFALFVLSPDVGGEDSFNLNARATRFGLNFTGPVILGAASGGQIEFDFHGQASTENRTGILLRHAYGEFRTDQWRFVGGQTWDVISPLIPGMLNYTVGWAAGNLGYRRAQARVERYVAVSDSLLWTSQFSLNQTIVSDFVRDPLEGGEDAGWPTVMGRMAASLGPRGKGCDPAVIGLSGHVGEEGVDFFAPPAEDDRRFFSWSFNVDARIPLTDSVGFQGEFFTGKVLGTFQGGINQGINRVQRVGVHSIGGWAEVWVYLTPKLHTHAGYSIDDPRNEDIAPVGRALNQVLFINAVYDITPLFDVGIEVSRWKTNYIGLRDAESVRVETVMRYRF